MEHIRELWQALLLMWYTKWKIIYLHTKYISGTFYRFLKTYFKVCKFIFDITKLGNWSGPACTFLYKWILFKALGSICAWVCKMSKGWQNQCISTNFSQNWNRSGTEKWIGYTGLNITSWALQRRPDFINLRK